MFLFQDLVAYHGVKIGLRALLQNCFHYKYIYVHFEAVELGVDVVHRHQLLVKEL